MSNKVWEVHIVTLLVVHLSKRIALTVAAVIGVVLITTTLYAALEGLVLAITVSMPSYVSDGASLVLPDNTTVCLAAVLSAHLLRWVYDWNVKIIQWKLL